MSTDRGRQIDGALSRKGGTPRENTRPARLELSGDALAGDLRRTEIHRAVERVVEELAGELKGANLIHDPPTWASTPRSWVANHDPSLDEYARICGDRLNRHPQGGRSLLLEAGVCPVVPDQRHQQLRPEHASRDLHTHGRRGIRSDNDWHPDIVPTLVTAGAADRPKHGVIVLNTIPCYRASVELIALNAIHSSGVPIWEENTPPMASVSSRAQTLMCPVSWRASVVSGEWQLERRVRR